MEQRISLITLAVDDLEATRRFFEDGLGWTQAPGGNEHIAFYQLTGSALALYSRAHLAKDLGRDLPAETLGGMTIAWNARSEEEVDTAYAEALTAGAEVVVRPEKVFWGGYSGYVSIPGGHLLEIAYNPFWPLSADGSITLPPADPEAG
ncbi:VOC family protein [Roseibium litorale]|uniref:VOC family protein n=1 Tax=Roseibium litorale TaxID=2803841 RepID=A0ABR9CSY7_9HYPH|nr:VOC family protein [Roseibium litorale]MBD8893962.1 VOC family protein [Roseibium litorale]